MAALNFDPGTFKALDANPGGTLELFNKYIETMELIFELAFRKADGTPYAPNDKEKKAMLLLRGGADMRDLFQHVGNVSQDDDYQTATDKIRRGLQSQTNSVVQRNLLLANFPQGSKSFEKWSKEITNAAKLINFEDYNWKQAAVDAMLLQTSNPKLRERALQENTKYEDLLKLGIAKELSQKGAALLQKASGQDALACETEEVRRLKLENKKLRHKLPCSRCTSEACDGRQSCPAMGQQCSKCSKMNHFSKACRAKPQTKKRSQRKKAVSFVWLTFSKTSFKC